MFIRIGKHIINVDSIDRVESLGDDEAFRLIVAGSWVELRGEDADIFRRILGHEFDRHEPILGLREDWYYDEVPGEPRRGAVVRRRKPHAPGSVQSSKA
jgi:hypothetical protein